MKPWKIGLLSAVAVAVVVVAVLGLRWVLAGPFATVENVK